MISIPLLSSITLFVHAQELKTVWLEVSLDSSSPAGFNYDIEFTLENKQIKRTYTLYELNSYKDNYELLQGTYTLQAKIIDNHLDLYKLVDVPKEIELNENSELNLHVEYNFSEMMEVDRLPKEEDNEDYVKEKESTVPKATEGSNSILEAALISVGILGIVGGFCLWMKNK